MELKIRGVIVTRSLFEFSLVMTPSNFNDENNVADDADVIDEKAMSFTPEPANESGKRCGSGTARQLRRGSNHPGMWDPRSPLCPTEITAPFLPYVVPNDQYRGGRMGLNVQNKVEALVLVHLGSSLRTRAESPIVRARLPCSAIPWRWHE
ncbi:hypothetical protein FHL15_010377 [Xylaria flabelliformis]|uniref:Uncharacterized protein n=1 Tax=Xylaria flabelliformis TaxID=2512241 RepID=A0A553HL78_9PEZI|nr:hypothetical protein FHL15_010377 [Xylaria flabelliformis]